MTLIFLLTGKTEQNIAHGKHASPFKFHTSVIMHLPANLGISHVTVLCSLHLKSNFVTGWALGYEPCGMLRIMTIYFMTNVAILLLTHLYNRIVDTD